MTTNGFNIKKPFGVYKQSMRTTDGHWETFWNGQKASILWDYNVVHKIAKNTNFGNFTLLSLNVSLNRLLKYQFFAWNEPMEEISMQHQREHIYIHTYTQTKYVYIHAYTYT